MLPENTRKPLIFCCFQGVENRNISQKWVKMLWYNTAIFILHNFRIYSIVQVPHESLIRILQSKTIIISRETEQKFLSLSNYRTGVFKEFSGTLVKIQGKNDVVGF